MRIAVLGSNGQVGQELIIRATNSLEIIPISTDILEFQLLESELRKSKPDVIINCAAYTAVDLAESEQEQAYTVNELGASNVAKLAAKIGARLIHISTDYVFDGKKGDSYLEEDRTNPINIYGKSKLAGEIAVNKAYASNSLIVRTASVHGSKGNNFVHGMLKLFKEREQLKVVEDQYMSPTWAGWLAEVLLQLAIRNETGIINVSSGAKISWYEFAKKIYELAAKSLEPLATKAIVSIAASEYKTRAVRPRCSSLAINKLEKLGIKGISWEAGLKAHLQELKLINE